MNLILILKKIRKIENLKIRFFDLKMLLIFGPWRYFCAHSESLKFKLNLRNARFKLNSGLAPMDSSDCRKTIMLLKWIWTLSAKLFFCDFFFFKFYINFYQGTFLYLFVSSFVVVVERCIIVLVGFYIL